MSETKVQISPDQGSLLSLQFYNEIKFGSPIEARHQILEDIKYTHLINKSIIK